MFQYGIAGLETPRGEDVLDGSLWTLQYEAFCYLVVGVLGLWAALRTGAAVLVLAVLAWFRLLAESRGLIPWDVPPLANQELSRFLLVFLLGAAGWRYADRVPVHWLLAALGGLLVGVAAHLPEYRLPGAVPFAYLCLYAMTRLPDLGVRAWDLSYGLYVYHWPIQFLLAMAGVTSAGAWVFVPLSLVLALVAAAISWRVVEEPALRWKNVRFPVGGRLSWPVPSSRG